MLYYVLTAILLTLSIALIVYLSYKWGCRHKTAAPLIGTMAPMESHKQVALDIINDRNTISAPELLLILYNMDIVQVDDDEWLLFGHKVRVTK